MSLISRLTNFGAAGAGGDSYWGLEVSGTLGLPTTQGDITSDSDNVYAMFRQGAFKSGDTRTKVPVMSISKDGVVNWQKMYGENQSSNYTSSTALTNTADYIFLGYEEGTPNGFLIINKSDGSYADSSFIGGLDGTINELQSACPSSFDGTNYAVFAGKLVQNPNTWNIVFLVNFNGSITAWRVPADNTPANIFYNTNIQVGTGGQLYGAHWRIHSSNNERQIFVWKLEDNASNDRWAQYDWAKRFASPDGATTVCECVGFTLDGNNNSFMTGYTRVSSSYEYLISKITNTGSLSTKRIVKSGFDWDNTQGSRNFMARDADNNIFILGKTIDQTNSYYVPRILKLDNAMNNILAHVELDHTDQFANWAFDIDPEGNIYFMADGLGASNNDMAIMKLPNDPSSIAGTYGDFEIINRSDASLTSYSNASWGDGVFPDYGSSSINTTSNGTDLDNSTFTTSLQDF